MRFEVSLQLWPWSGFLALYLRVKDSGAAYEGVASGEVRSFENHMHLLETGSSNKVCGPDKANSIGIFSQNAMRRVASRAATIEAIRFAMLLLAYTCFSA